MTKSVCTNEQAGPLRKSPRKASVKGDDRNNSPSLVISKCYRIQAMSEGFVLDPMSVDKTRTDGIWQHFLAGILKQDGKERKKSPFFGSELLIRAVITSFAKAHEASEHTNKIISLSNWELEGLESKLTSMSKSKISQELTPLAMLDALPRTWLGVDKTIQLQGDFELQDDGMGAIKQLLSTKAVQRQCSHLQVLEDGCLHQFKCREDESASSFIRNASLLAMPEKFRMATKNKKNLSDSEWRLHMLRFDMVAAVASVFPFARYGDCITFIVGGPWISNHFFPVVIVKTTDGLAGAVLDSYKGDYDIRLTKNCQYSENERTDVLGLLQAFLAINDHILLPEYSIQDRRKIIEELEFHFPTAYRQPSSSNACWLYSIAVIEQLYLLSSELINIRGKESAHKFFDDVALAVSRVFSDFEQFNGWVKDLKIKHWDAQISEDNVTVVIDGKQALHYFEVGEVDTSLINLSKWEHSTTGYEVSEPLFSPESGNQALKSSKRKKLHALARSASRNSLALTQESDLEAWKSNLAQTLDTLKLSCAPSETSPEKIAHLVDLTKKISEFGSVLTQTDLNKEVSNFLDDPAKSLSVEKGCVFMKCEQNWPQYNKGQGGADLVLSARSQSTNQDGDPKQVVIFHAAHARSFVAGKSGATNSSVNGAQSNDFLFCAVPTNRFAKYYDSMVPTYAWPNGLQLVLAKEHVSRPSIGGQSNIFGESVAVQVKNWKSVNSTKGKNDITSQNKESVELLTTLNKIARIDKRQRHTLDFKHILSALKGLSNSRGFSAESAEVNILPVPGDGCCFPHSCSLSVMLSANPDHGFKFYAALFPKPLHFTSLHRYVFKDSLTACARFWFARWCCQKHDIREILEQSVKMGVCSHGQEGAGLSRDMTISDFLNLISRSSDQVEDGHSHYFYTTLLHLFRAFLSEVLHISISILVLTSDRDNILLLAKEAVANLDDLQSHHFLVLSRSGGQNTASSHYTPVLLDFEHNKIWGSCGLLPYQDLPRFIRELVCCKTSAIQNILRRISNFDEPNELALPLFSETRLSRDLFLWRVTLISNLNLTTYPLGRTVLCAPLYSIGLLGPYPNCASARQCMQMFQGHMKTAHNHICATVLRAMECIVTALCICLSDYETPSQQELRVLFNDDKAAINTYYGSFDRFHKHQRQALQQVKNCQTLVELTSFASTVCCESSDEGLVNWFCSQCQESSSLSGNFAGIPSVLYWGLYSSILNCPIVVLNDTISTWDSHKSRNDVDVLGKHFSADVLLKDEEIFGCDRASLLQKAKEILPKYLYGLRDMETKVHSIPVASDALSSIMNKIIGCTAGDPCGSKDVNGSWKLDTYARNGLETTEIILSSANFSTAGFMPVMTKIQMNLPHALDKLYLHEFRASFSDLHTQVSTCKLALLAEKFWTEELFRGFIFSIGRTGHVEQFPRNDLVSISKAEWAIFDAHITELALQTRNSLQNEIDIWLNLGSDTDISKVNLQSSELLRAQVLERWFMGEQVSICLYHVYCNCGQAIHLNCFCLLVPTPGKLEHVEWFFTHFMIKAWSHS